MNQPITLTDSDYDATGKNPSFHRQERHNATSINDGEFQIIIPFEGPFFEDRFVLIDHSTGSELIFGLDYVLGGYYPELTKYTEKNKPIYGVIVLLDGGSRGTYDIEYQKFGGFESINKDDIVREMIDRRLNPTRVYWADIINTPITYPPEPHKHYASEVGGYDELVNEVLQLRLVLSEQLAYMKSSEPSLVQLIQEQFYFTDKLVELNGRIDDVVREMKSITNQTASGLNERITGIEDKLRAGEGDIDRRLSSLESRDDMLNNELQTLIGEVRNEIKNRLSNLSTLIQDIVERTPKDLTSFMDTTRTKLSWLEGVSETISRKVTNNKTAMTNLIDDLKSKVEVLKQFNNTLANIYLPINNPTSTGTATFDTVSLKHMTFSYKKPTIDIGNGILMVKTVDDDYLLRIENDKTTINRFVPGSGATLHGVTPHDYEIYSSVGYINLGYGQTKAKAYDFVSTRGTHVVRLSDAVNRNGDHTDTLFMKPFSTPYTNGAEFLKKEDAKYCAPIARSDIIANDKYLHGKGFHYAARTSNGKYIRRMIAFSVNEPNKAFLQSWDLDGNYLGAFPITQKIVSRFEDSHNEDLDAPSISLLRVVNSRFAPETSKRNVADGYNKAPILFQDRGLMIADKLVFRTPNDSTNMGTISFKKLGNKTIFDFSNEVRLQNYSVTSDKRLKEDIVPYDYHKGDIKQIKPKHYTRTIMGEKHDYTGLIAQDVYAQYPEVISKDENGFLSIDYTALTAILFGVVGDLKARIEILESKNKEGKGK